MTVIERPLFRPIGEKVVLRTSYGKKARAPTSIMPDGETVRGANEAFDGVSVPIEVTLPT